jgi:LysR family hydrogen peroxide-inducible transcriptional activator
MKLRHLSYFLAVAHYKHFGKAAEACHVSQPGLSMQIQKLEALLGVQLVERNNKQVLITDIGHEVAKLAQSVTHQIQAIEDLCKTARDPFNTSLKLGSFPTLAPYLFPIICPLIKDKHPQLQLFLIEEKTEFLLNQLEQGELDAAILALPADHPWMQHEILFKDPFMLAVHPQHQLTKKSHVTTNELADHDLLLLNEGHCLREQALDVCAMNRTKEQSTFQATSLETLRLMIQNKLAITLMPKIATKAHSQITYIPFSTPVPHRTIAMVQRKHAAKHIATNSISQLIIELFQ